MTRKWKDDRGETLVEVLASILIGALSVALLFTAVMASVNMDRSAKEVDEKFYEYFSKAEQQAAPDVTGKSVTVQRVAVPVGETPPGPVTVAVNFYGGVYSGGGVWSYALP